MALRGSYQTTGSKSSEPMHRVNSYDAWLAFGRREAADNHPNDKPKEHYRCGIQRNVQDDA
jgi:hypothetical protein